MRLALIALHQLTVGNGSPTRAEPIGATSADELPSDTVAQLGGYVADLERRDELEGSRATAGWFDPSEPGELRALRDAGGVAAFDAASRGAMARLADKVRGNASSGVVLFLGGEDGRLACFKLDPGRRTLTRVQPGAHSAAGALDVATLEDVLPEPRDLKKGALLPSPSGADVRVVDLTKTGDPAGYWVQFLGATSIRAAVTAERLVTASIAALEAEDVPSPRARELVATRWQAVVQAPAPVAPRAFVDGLSEDAGLDAGAVWDHARRMDGGLSAAHAVVPPVIARRLKRTVDLGGGVRVVGPQSAVDPRLEEGSDADGTFVKVRATQQPVYELG